MPKKSMHYLMPGWTCVSICGMTRFSFTTPKDLTSDESKVTCYKCKKELAWKKALKGYVIHGRRARGDIVLSTADRGQVGYLERHGKKGWVGDLIMEGVDMNFEYEPTVKAVLARIEKETGLKTISRSKANKI